MSSGGDKGEKEKSTTNYVYVAPSTKALMSASGGSDKESEGQRPSLPPKEKIGKAGSGQSTTCGGYGGHGGGGASRMPGSGFGRESGSIGAGGVFTGSSIFSGGPGMGSPRVFSGSVGGGGGSMRFGGATPNVYTTDTNPFKGSAAAWSQSKEKAAKKAEDKGATKRRTSSSSSGASSSGGCQPGRHTCGKKGDGDKDGEGKTIGCSMTCYGCNLN